MRGPQAAELALAERWRDEDRMAATSISLRRAMRPGRRARCGYSRPAEEAPSLKRYVPRSMRSSRATSRAGISTSGLQKDVELGGSITLENKLTLAHLSWYFFNLRASLVFKAVFYGCREVCIVFQSESEKTSTDGFPENGGVTI